MNYLEKEGIKHESFENEMNLTQITWISSIPNRTRSKSDMILFLHMEGIKPESLEYEVIQNLTTWICNESDTNHLDIKQIKHEILEYIVD